MRIRLSRGHFSVVLRNGSQQFGYPWKWLVPVAAVPLLLAAAMAVSNANARWFLASHPANYQAAFEELQLEAETVTKNLLAVSPIDTESSVPTVHLVVPKNTLNDMQKALQYGDRSVGRDDGGMFQYFEAVYIDEQKDVHECKLALRGISSWHHQAEKPSLRVRIKKDDITSGRRYIELQRPEDVLALKNWLPQKFAEELGLLSDCAEHVRVFINNKYFGVYLRTMRCGEPMAIANGRMPGTFFKGEAGETIWYSLTDWGLSGDEDADNHAVFEQFLGCVRGAPDAEVLDQLGELVEADLTGKDNAGQLMKFLVALQHKSTPESLDQLRQLLDTEVYAKWSALMIATGSIHTDRIHNQVYFLCSNQGKIEAVPWDCNSFGVHSPFNVPVDTIRHPVMERIICDPLWVHRRNQHLYQLLNNQAETKNLHRLIDTTVDQLLRDLQADRYLSSIRYTSRGWVLVPAPVVDIEKHRQEIKEWVRERNAFLSRYLSAARVSVQAIPSEPGVSEVHVFEAVAVDVQSSAGGTVLVENSAADTPNRLYPGLSSGFSEFRSAPHEPDAFFRVYYVKPAPLAYRVHGSPDELTFTNAITGASARILSPPISETPVRTIHPSHFGAAPRDDIVLGPGEVLMDSDLVTAPGQRLIIVAGTQVMLSEGVSIHASGPVQANGTADQPIVFRASGDMPWGAVGICGSETGGTVLRHVRMDGGSIGSRGGLRYKGMLSVYGCPNVLLEHCDFGKNHVGDDAVNLAESCIRVADCTWSDALADALDLDMCRGTLSRCRWTGAGNDGLDLMTCRVSIDDSHFESNGDKGISVGENTRAIVSNCHITDCNIGVEAKDSSRVLLTDTLLDGNRVAIHAYQKKWVYSRGGDVALDRCTFRENEEADLSIEKRCSVIVCRTTVGNVLTGHERISSVGELPDDWSNLLPDAENTKCLPIATN